MDGSQWQKWDLHVHTPDSFINGYKFEDEDEREKYHDLIWEKYIDELEKIKDISVIGITDYFSISGYKKILEYRKAGRLSNFQLILPNIEFRLDVLAGKENKRLNYHVIFSEELDPELIEREFLGELHIKSSNSEKRTLTTESIIDIGSKIKQQHEEFRSKSDIVAGFDVITVNLNEIMKVLNNKKSIFFGKYLLVLSAPIWDEISWDGQGHLERKTIFINSHALFSSQKSTIDFCLGKKVLDPGQFLEEFGSFKPCIHGSDAHSFNKLCKPDEDRFCWIKALPIFDGLKQIIFEPKDRVKIQKNTPESYKNVYSLKSVEFYDSDINNDISIVPQKIYFNKNFVSVTGGKGSGKTAILDLIANCYVNRWRNDADDETIVDKNSFVQRVQGDTDKLAIKIEFIGDSIEPFSKTIKESTIIEKSPITYLPQGKIEEISGDKLKLNEKIEEIVFNNEKVKAGNYKDKFTETKGRTISLSKQIIQINNRIFSLENDTTDAIFSKHNSEKEIALGKISDLKNQVKTIETSLEEGIQEKITTFKKEIKKLKIEMSKITEIIDEIRILRGGLENFAVSSNNSIEGINKKICDADIDLQIPNIDVNDQLKALDFINQMLLDKSNALSKAQIHADKSLFELSGEEKNHTKLLKEIESIEKEIEKTDKIIIALNAKKEQLENLKSERVKLYKQLLETYLEWKKYYNDVILTFSLGKNEILGDIQFKSSIFFDFTKFLTSAEDIFNKKKISPDEIERVAQSFEKAFVNYFNQDETFDQIIKLIDTYLNKPDLIKKTRLKNVFYDWIFGNYFTLNTEIEFKETSIDKLSMGQKGTVLLKLFLAEGEYPIILDQPEENLDNKFIYNELVGAMRNAKINRQVIIATNNANLVVNTDAEQIIIADYDAGKIGYKSGALESPTIREEIMPLLEGGSEAFKRREQKYGILGYNL